MCRKHKFANIAYKNALDSSMNFKHGAIITKGSKVIVTGNNKENRTKILGQIHTCIHAEIDVANKLMNILRNKKNKNLNKYILWVVRAPNDKILQGKNIYRNSKPCKLCVQKLRKLGFSKIGYSDDVGNIIVQFIDDIQDQIMSHAQSSLFKYLKK